MTNAIIHDRARAKELCALSGIKKHPWSSADNNEKAAQEAAAIAAAEAKILQDAQDAAEFKAAFTDVERLLADKAALTQRILAKTRELEGLGNAGQIYKLLIGWQKSPAGIEWTMTHRRDISRLAGPDEPLQRRGTPPLGVTWDDIDRAAVYEKKCRELDALRNQLAPVSQCLALHYGRFAVLRELEGVR